MIIYTIHFILFIGRQLHQIVDYFCLLFCLVFFIFKSTENRTPLHFEITRTIERKVIEISHQRPILEKNSD